MENIDLINQHKDIILKWEKEFKENLTNNINKTMELYLIDKEWFEDYKKAVFSDNIQNKSKIRNYHNFQPIDYTHIIYNKRTINPDANFILLNKESFKSFSPNLISKNSGIKLIVQFFNNKVISQIGSKLFYFYYNDNDHEKDIYNDNDNDNIIKQGFFIIGDIDEYKTKVILDNFMKNNIGIFKRMYFNGMKPTLQKYKKSKLYHLDDFDFIIKIDNNEYNTINKTNGRKNLSFMSYNDIQKTERNMNIFDNNIKSKIKQKSKEEKTKIKNINVKKSKLRLSSVQYNPYNINNSIIFNNSLSKSYFFSNKMTERKYLDICDCIYEYFYSQIKYKNFINGPKRRLNHFIPINKNWLKDFLSKCNYDKINTKLIKENKTIKYKQIINHFLYENNLFNIQMDDIPRLQINSIKNKYKYFTNYELITKKSYNAFISTFENKKVNKEFDLYTLDDYNYIIIKYNNFSGEIRSKNGQEKYFIFSDEYLEEIINNILENGLLNGLHIYGVYFNKYFLESQLLDGDKSIGILINLNSKEITIEKEEDDDDNIINNEEEVFDNKIDNNKKLFNSNSSIFFLNSKKLNKVKVKKRLSPQCSLRKNINIDSINLNNDEINAKSSYSPNTSDINNDSTIRSIKIPKCPNTQKMSNNIYSNFFTNNIYLKKNNFSYNYEQMTKPKLENEIQEQYPTHINQVKIINYNNPPIPSKTKKITKDSYNYNIYNNLNEYSEYIISYSKGLIGLANIGATCYMNATIQCFSNIPRLREYLLNENNYQNLYYGRKGNKKLSFALAHVFKNLWLNQNLKCYAPEYFKDVISEMNPLFRGKVANDSKDLILFILENIHNELNTKYQEDYNQKPNNLDFFSVFNTFMNYYRNNNESIISEEFYGYYDSMMKCCSCQTITHNVQVLNILFFPLEEVRKYIRTPYNFVNLDNCFEYYEKPEVLNNSNKILCDFCKRNTTALNQKKIIISPKTLIINLNRGKGLQYNVGIHFEEFINLKKYIFYNRIKPYYYELVGVISHLGSNDMGGHFIAYCKNSYDCKWYKYNDSIVTKSSFEEIGKIGLPYVLFYIYVKT